MQCTSLQRVEQLIEQRDDILKTLNEYEQALVDYHEVGEKVVLGTKRVNP